MWRFFWWGFCSSCKAPPLDIKELGKGGKTRIDFSQIKKKKEQSKANTKICNDLHWLRLPGALVLLSCLFLAVKNTLGAQIFCVFEPGDVQERV